MEGQIFKDISTELDLNGPYLSFSTDPSDQTASSGSVTYTGIATCSYGISGPENIGTVTYQWYEHTGGSTAASFTGTKLSNGSGPTGTTYTVAGATSNSLTIANLISGTDDSREFYVEAQYTPAQLDYESGNPPNEPLNSDKAGVTIAPTINVTSQPTSINVGVDVQTTFSVDASLSDGTGRTLTYQWYVDGVAETDRTKTVTINTSTTVATPHSYSWSSNASHTLPNTAYDISATIVGSSGGPGGRDAGGNGAPGKSGRGGTFTFSPNIAGSDLKFRIGSQGSGGGNCAGQCGGSGGQVTGAGDGTRGGGAGNRGWSGAGGGAGAASYIQGPTGYLIVAGGGGGGGGGSHNRGGISRTPGNTPGDALDFQPYPGPVPLSDGQPTGDWENSGDGGGGGGGGGGSPGGNTGNRGHDKNHGAYTGYGGGSRYDDPRVDGVSATWAQNGNGYGALSYMSTSTVSSTETRRTVYSGTSTSTLTIKSDWQGAQNVYCRVSFSGATNTPVDSDTVIFAVVPGVGSENVVVETIDDFGATLSQVATSDLRSGPMQFDTQNGGDYKDDVISFYAPNKDIDVFIDMYGARGDNYPFNDGNYSLGGSGGYGRFKWTLKQNQEYVIAGLSTDIGAPYFYEGGQLVAVMGQGGSAGKWNTGGDGGGFTIKGEDGPGGSEGGDNVSHRSGNTAFGYSDLRGNGCWGSIMRSQGYTSSGNYNDNVAATNDGGRTINCTKGVYWWQQGKAPCSTLGTSNKFVTSNGSTLSGSASITRGYKAGYAVMVTGGNGTIVGSNSHFNGDGGNGATGGVGSSGSGNGGAGGSGWISDTSKIVTEQRGTSTDLAKVIIRLQ